MPDIRLIPVFTVPVKGNNNERVVIIDSLRATSTIITAFYNGCKEIYPAANIREALKKKQALVSAGVSENEILLGGEKSGKKPSGFDLGNSPGEYSKEIVREKRIILTTTNGTRALIKVQNAGEVLIGAWLNSRQIARYLLKGKSPVTFLCAGTRGMFSLEDFFTAGKIIALMEQFSQGTNLSFDKEDGALTAEYLYRSYQGMEENIFGSSVNGTRLREEGEAKDISFCLQTDEWKIIPFFKQGRIIVNQID